MVDYYCKMSGSEDEYEPQINTHGMTKAELRRVSSRDFINTKVSKCSTIGIQYIYQIEFKGSRGIRVIIKSNFLSASFVKIIRHGLSLLRARSPRVQFQV